MKTRCFVCARERRVTVGEDLCWTCRKRYQGTSGQALSWGVLLAMSWAVKEARTADRARLRRRAERLEVPVAETSYSEGFNAALREIRRWR
jgi:hypothetical protein